MKYKLLSIFLGPETSFQQSINLVGNSAVSFLILMTMLSSPANAQSKDSVDKTQTLLLPLFPKLDETKTSDSAQSHISKKETKSIEASIEDDQFSINEDTTLKGTIQIVADNTEYDEQKNTFMGTGNAVAIIVGENSKLEADVILYDQNADLIDARGNVRIFRNGEVSIGSSFKFKVSSDEYLITNPDTEVQGTAVIARKAYGTGTGLSFKNGTMTLPRPLYMSSSPGNAPISYQDEIFEKRVHPEAFAPANPSYKFTARKMVYEKYKESGNLTVFGGRFTMGKLSIKLPKFVTTVGQESVVFPVTPYIGNNLMSGGLNFGPNFHRSLGKFGVLSYAPLIQLGGQNIESTSTSGIGVGAQIGLRNQRLQANLAYGSNSDLLVGDLRYKISRTMKFQAGINRYLEDGLYGYRRAQAIAEVIDNRGTNKIPFLANLNFRTSGGWARDNPQLLNLTPSYAELFTQPTTTQTTSAFRLQEHISASTHPLFKLGNEKYGLSSNLSGGLGLRYYSTGDAMAMAQVGPNLEVFADRLKMRLGYTQSAVRGESPFVFDEFIQGSRSAYVSGAFKLNNYVTLGGSVGYNLVDRLAYSRTLSAAIGPEDFKILLTRDFISGNQRFGFDVLIGNRIPFQRLILKGAPDHGQLGGI